MKFKLRNIISLLLVLCMFIQPLTPLMASQPQGTTTSRSSTSSSNINSGSTSSKNANTGSSSASLDKAKKEFEAKYKEVMALKPIELGTVAKGVVGISSFVDNCKQAVKDGLDGKKTKKEDYNHYLKDIKEANQKIADAKKQMQQMKKEFDSGNYSNLNNANKQASGALAAQQKAAANTQSSFKKTGETLKKVGDVLNKVGKVLSYVTPVLEVAGGVLAATGALSAVGAACIAVAKVTGPLALALPVAGSSLKGAGEGLIKAANIGATSDKALLTTVGKETVKEAAPAAVGAAVGVVVGGKLGQSVVNKVASSGVAQKVLGESAEAVVKGVWNPKGAVSDALAKN